VKVKVKLSQVTRNVFNRKRADVMGIHYTTEFIISVKHCGAGKSDQHGQQNVISHSNSSSSSSSSSSSFKV
jgi:type 1 fimbria pilin